MEAGPGAGGRTRTPVRFMVLGVECLDSFGFRDVSGLIV